MRRKLRWVVVALVGLIGVGLAGLAILLVASRATPVGMIEASGPRERLVIRRDAYAVPTIEASTPADALFGLGFAHAQDRLWQMELQRRTAQGRLAELLGEPALPTDRFLRTLGLYRAAEAGVAALSVEAQALLEAYAAGINALLVAHTAPLPPEFLILRHRPEPWRPADSLAVLRLMALDLDGNWREELLRVRLAERVGPERLGDLFPSSPAGAQATVGAMLMPGVPPLGPFADRACCAVSPDGLGSNVFVLGGERTADGKPLLASDPHLALRAPGTWYLASLQSPELAAVGGTIPGLPLVVIGRNRDVAWGLTTTYADVQDLFIERVDPNDPAHYLAHGGSLPFTIRAELLLVRNGAARPLTVRLTRHGPVISDVTGGAPDGHVLALSWPALLSDDRTFEAGLGVAAAQDAQSLRIALEGYGAPVQNIAFADRAGSIGLAVAGRVPIRRAGDGTRPVEGWTGGFDWTGFIAPAELPAVVEPPAGLIVNANDRLVGPDYPHLVTATWPSAMRATRLRTLLDGAPPIDLAAAAAIQFDQRSMLQARFRPVLKALGGARTAADAEIVEALLAWEGDAGASRPEPLIFTAWFMALAEAVYGDELGEMLDDYGRLRAEALARMMVADSPWCDNVRTPAVESCGELAAPALDVAVARLKSEFGADWRSWRWGGAHSARMAHLPFGRLPWLGPWFDIEVEVGGDGSSVNVAHPRGGGDGPGRFAAIHMAGLRVLAPLAGDRLLAVAATGQSGHPLSPHYRDLTALWARGDHLELSLAPPRGTEGIALTIVPRE